MGTKDAEKSKFSIPAFKGEAEGVTQILRQRTVCFSSQNVKSAKKRH
jgi:hypothetical protein